MRRRFGAERIGRDARPVPYALLVASVTAASLMLRQPQLLVVAAPFAASLALAAVRATGESERPAGGRTEPTPESTEEAVSPAVLELADHVAIEGEAATLLIEIPDSAGRRLAIRFDPADGVEVLPRAGDEQPIEVWDFTPAGPTTLEVPLLMHDWGRYSPGHVRVREAGPGSMFVSDHQRANAPEIKVLPGRQRVKEILRPLELRGSAGHHLSKLVRAGTDFAEIRPYQPGDRLRDLNLAATRRLGTPHVNRHHPELSGQVIVMLDTARDDGGQRSETGRAVLTLCAKGAWAVTEQHLRAQDRVGVFAFGGNQRWVQPTSGRFGKQQLLDAILDVGIGVESTRHDHVTMSRAVRPNDLVVAFTPLWDERPIRTLARLRKEGRQVVAVVLDPTALLPPPLDAGESHGREIWQMLREELMEDLAVRQVPVVGWSGEGGLAGAVRETLRLQSRHEVRR